MNTITTIGLISMLTHLAASASQMTDMFADRPQETAASAVLTADITYATYETGEAYGMHGSGGKKTVWAEWIAPANGVVTIDTQGTTFSRPAIAIYAGSEIRSLTAVARAFERSGTSASVRFPVASGMAYQIVLDSDSPHYKGLGRVNISLKVDTLDSPASVVASDLFGERPILNGHRAIGVANTLKAKRENFEPDVLTSSKGATVWWEWTAPANGRVSVDTLGSDFNTILLIFAGESDTDIPFSGLDPVAANDNVLNAKTSRVDFQTQAGRTYQILVDGWAGYHLTSMGNVVLNLNFTANTSPGAIPGGDDFSRRGILTGVNAAGVANNTDFASEAYEAIPSGNKNTARWEWTAPESCTVIIDTFGSDFDTMLTLFTGKELAFLTPVASNDNATGTISSRVEFKVTRGVTYQIMVNGRSLGRTGNIALNLNRVLLPEVSIQQPVGNNLKDELSKTSFGKIKIGSKSSVKKFTIRNTGTATLDGIAIRRTGSHATDFIIRSYPKTSLAPGESTTFSVVFAPKAKGTRIGGIQIMSNDADENPFTIILVGLGKRY